jgi:hypothetical protein
MSADSKIKLAALWIKKDKNGGEYLMGDLGDNLILIFPNNRKENPRHPDYISYLSPKQRIEGGQRRPQTSDNKKEETPNGYF